MSLTTYCRGTFARGHYGMRRAGSPREVLLRRRGNGEIPMFFAVDLMTNGSQAASRLTLKGLALTVSKRLVSRFTIIL